MSDDKSKEPKKKIVFWCHYGGLTISMEHIKEKFDHLNRKVAVSKGIDIEFRENKYETDDPKIIDFIRSHNFYGTNIFEEGRTKYIPTTAKPPVPGIPNSPGRVEALNKDNVDLARENDNLKKQNEELQKSIEKIKSKK